jgi:hypothetical protein
MKVHIQFMLGKHTTTYTKQQQPKPFMKVHIQFMLGKHTTTYTIQQQPKPSMKVHIQFMLGKHTITYTTNQQPKQSMKVHIQFMLGKLFVGLARSVCQVFKYCTNVCICRIYRLMPYSVYTEKMPSELK